jgi:hypothetical protein
MKKALVILVSLAAVLVLSCGTTGGATGASGGPIEGAGNLGAFSLTLTDNMANGRNFQGVVQNPLLLNGHRVSRGESYTLKATYTASRNVTRPIGVGFADMNGGWATLSWRQPGGIDIPSPAVGGAEFPASNAGETVNVEITINISSSAPGTNPRANTLVFATLDTTGPVTLNFTEFTLTRN